MLSILLLACSPNTDDSGAGLAFCQAILVDQPAPADADQVLTVLGDVRDHLYPELDGVVVDLVEGDSKTDFFVANLDLSTISALPLERDYRVIYSRNLFSDPAPYAGVAAILAHELKHVVDYTGMDTEALVEFALWYAEGDFAEYERATDEHVLELGCGEGLSAYRSWLYGRVDDETQAQKRIDYYTPEEIAAWMEHNP